LGTAGEQTEMSQMKRQIRIGQVAHRVMVLLVLWGSVLFPDAGLCETYGVKDAGGTFAPKLDVVVEKKEVVIKKVDPQDKFRIFALKINPGNQKLLRNVAGLQMEWVGPGNRAGKPVPFAGPRYDRNTNVFQEDMIRSVGLRILDKSTQNLFVGKKLAELFSISIDNQPVISAESANEKERTVRLDEGRDVSITVDRNAVVFTESNFGHGEIVNVENRAGREQILGVDLPKKGFVLGQILRKNEQTKIPPGEWNRFKVPAEQGIGIVLIPDSDPAISRQLNGKEIVIRVYQGNEVRETRRIPIELSSDILSQAPERVSSGTGPSVPPEKVVPLRDNTTTQKAGRPENSSRRSDVPSGLWLWVFQIANLILLVFLAVYTIFFMLPKVQVLEDRVAKSEMFLHGSREAIREELDQIKREIVQQCQQDEAQE
jgi:hypothetical protein